MDKCKMHTELNIQCMILRRNIRSRIVHYKIALKNLNDNKNKLDVDTSLIHNTHQHNQSYRRLQFKSSLFCSQKKGQIVSSLLVVGQKYPFFVCLHS